MDGEEHVFKLGVEYPSGSGKYTYESARFEAIEAPPVPEIQQLIVELKKRIPELNPYLETPAKQAPMGIPGGASSGSGAGAAGQAPAGPSPGSMTPPSGGNVPKQ